MRIVVATEDGKAASHFGHCSQFIVYETENGKVKSTEVVDNPYYKNHVAGEIPKFVESLKADILIVDGIGKKAIALLEKMDIEVLSGNQGKAENLVDDYIKGKIRTNRNPCNH